VIRAMLSGVNRMLGGRIARRMVSLAEQGRQLGNLDGARVACEAALALEPANEAALLLSAQIDLPGPDYLAVLKAIHEKLRPHTYVEVGVAAGDSLRLAAPETRVIGIDPAPELEAPAGANTTILRMPSDEAFSGEALRAALAGAPVDLGFIDGMHRCEFALRDFMNLERLCGRDATILLHDCYPLNRLTSERERRTAFWSGDTWRTVVALKRYRPDLRVHTIAAPPTGLALVRGLDPASRVLAEGYEGIVTEMLATDFSLLERDKATVLNRCPNDWSRISALLAT
jgi:hypothetical protein